MLFSLAQVLGVEVQLTVHSWGPSSMWGVTSLIVLGKKRQDLVQEPKPSGIHISLSPASCYDVASGRGVHWSGLWKLTVVIWYVTEFHYSSRPRCFCVVRLQVTDSSVLSIIWQTSFSSVGTFALCDGDFPRWGFYSGPRYGVVTAGGDTARNARSGGGASFRVSVCLRWQCGGETGHGVPSVSCVALELTFLMTSNYLKIQ